MGWNWVESCCVPHIFLALFICSFHSTDAQFSQLYPKIANLSSSWINNITGEIIVNGSVCSPTLNPILVRESNDPGVLCGFCCRYESRTCLFSVLIFRPLPGSFNDDMIHSPQVVWSANRNNPVRINATLELTGEGDLILADADGTLVWSTDTAGKNVSGLELTETGNLVLFDRNNMTVWESFDHPTDALVPGQKLVSGKRLTASVSAANWTEGLFSVSVTNESLVAYVDSNPPQFYYEDTVIGTKSNAEPSYVRFRNGSLALFIHTAEPNNPDSVISIPVTSSAQFMKLEPDGHLRVYNWQGSKWQEVADLLTEALGDCGYPMICGKYGICSDGQCTCPGASTEGTTYFREINDRQPNLGCYAVSPISCGPNQYHGLLELEDIYYFDFRLDIANTDMENCKQSCLNNCSCKAALFRYGSDSSSGGCFLLPEVFSLLNNIDRLYNFNSSMFLKVEKPPIEKKRRRTGIILGSSLGAFFGVIIFIGTCFLLVRKKRESIEAEEDCLDLMPGMPTRFSYEDLKAATDNFSHKLGEGGFGSVFEGTLTNGTKVAVKLLDGLGQVKKSFLAEVETIGSIHHVNLVRLIGFCAQKSQRLLVYEYMCNGSLDKWIFHRNQGPVLGWKSRRKIILDIAKGLSYLHEECRQKIFHLDIKPQNILLDEYFNAKVSDFGLSKLIDRDQSQVVTTMRGTPGYLAPEWLNSVITEKVDVYSFGVVVLEILCGRKNIDRSQAEEDMHLLSVFKRKSEQEQLLDIVDKYSEDMQLHGAQAVETMKVAAWCLQIDFSKRPSMSVVVKVLEGSVDIVNNLDYNFSSLALPGPLPVAGDNMDVVGSATPLLASVLSGPR